VRQIAALTAALALTPAATGHAQEAHPFVVVLGIAQDGGVPQAGGPDRGFERQVVSLAVVDPESGQRWLLEATPDFREQLRALDGLAPSPRPAPALDGIFLTHAHMGHYTGLMFLGHESMGAKEVPVYVPPAFAAYLETSGPWSQLVEYQNIVLVPSAPGASIKLNDRISITPFVVPHRQEYSEVVGYRIEGPRHRVLFIPDIDSWEQWEAMGTSLEQAVAEVDVAYLDGSFFDDGEIPGRDMSGFPHPRMQQTMDLLQDTPADMRAKVHFIHLNHTNPALDPGSTERQEIERRGYHVAEEGERVDL
jgi:pyrroloquinoline quinone biosynthesis protein B